jgi:hypothetical protein
MKFIHRLCEFIHILTGRKISPEEEDIPWKVVVAKDEAGEETVLYFRPK